MTAFVTGLIIDSFAGGGGASTGIEMALGRSPDVAINHDPQALAMHAANHPRTIHLTENVWKVDPHAVTGGKPVLLLWASPDCRHHSKAKGGAPVSRSVRGLADVVILWARVARPQIICLENVEEFADWGPLDGEGRPCARRKGADFARWVRALEAEGYALDWRELRACDYGAPTIRKRLFVVARRDGFPIVWPQPSHGDPRKCAEALAAGALKPWRMAAEIIDWSLPCPSIFMTRDAAKAAGLQVVRPLADKTMSRIARGFKRYVLDRAEPFVVTLTEGLRAPHLMTMRNSGKPYTAADEPMHTITAGGAGLSVVEGALAPFVSYAQQGGASRPADAPIHTICANAKDQNQVVTAYMAQHNGGARGPLGRDMDAPASTLTTSAAQQQPIVAYLAGVGGRMGQSGERPLDKPYHTITTKPDTVIVLPHLTAYYGAGDGQASDAPLRTATTLDRFGHVEACADAPPLSDAQRDRARQVAAFLRGQGVWDVGGAQEFVVVGPYVVVDIGMRMLTPRELARAQGFPDSYILAAPYEGGALTETAQRRMIGNSVCPDVAAALARANCIEALTLPRVEKTRRAKLPKVPAFAPASAPAALFAEAAA